MGEMAMKWIGLTGGIASGKSTVTKILRTLGYEVLDADEISHQVTDVGGPALAQIFKVFGAEVQNSDGSLNRKVLGSKVFGRVEELKKLEAIVHPLVRQKIADEKTHHEKTGRPVLFYDVPLLYEKHMQKDFDAVVLVSSSEKMQKLRLMQRNSLTEKEAEARLQSQIPLKEKETKTPFVIHNDRDLVFLESEVKRVLNELKIAKN